MAFLFSGGFQARISATPGDAKFSVSHRLLAVGPFADRSAPITLAEKLLREVASSPLPAEFRGTTLPERLTAITENFFRKSILLVGDVMLDEYLWGFVKRISPEAPVPVVEFSRYTYALGGAANVAANVAALNGSAHLGGVVGRDRGRDLLRAELTRRLVDGYLIDSQDRTTTIKTRIIGGTQQVLRVDREGPEPIAEREEALLLKWGRDHIQKADCILISDYAKGTITTGLAQGFVELGRNSGKPVVVDPKGSDFSKYRGATVITPNLEELRAAAMRLTDPDKDLSELAHTVNSALDGTSIAVTRGPDGVSLFIDGADEIRVPASVRQVFDVTGAGDTFAAALALAVAAGAHLDEASRIGNVAAGIAVAKVGTATVNLHELTAEL